MSRPKLSERPIIVTDTETTGLDPELAAIVELAAVKLDPKTLEEVGCFHSLVRPFPGAKIEPSAMDINGLSPAQLEVAPELNVVLKDYAAFADGGVLAGHNVGFDKGFLTVAFRRCGVPMPQLDYHALDTASLAWPLMYEGGLPGVSMKYIAPYLGLNQGQSHRALDDARTSAQLLRVVMKRFNNSK